MEADKLKQIEEYQENRLQNRFKNEKISKRKLNDKFETDKVKSSKQKYNYVVREEELDELDFLDDRLLHKLKK